LFERYTEPARRTLFFARYEASQRGSLSIETEHLLLGLTHEEKGFASQILAAAHLSLENVSDDMKRLAGSREKAGTGVEIPFSAETKRVLQGAAEEADRLLHHHIGPEHLLLGVLREEESFAAAILKKNGFTLAGLRDQVSVASQAAGGAGPRDRADAAMELGQMKTLVDRLADSLADQDSSKQLIDQIRFYLERLQERFRP
jgi:ATP-dependent Clp protease ATP-binding subunit ClpC